jgi:hypothetical protein
MDRNRGGLDKWTSTVWGKGGHVEGVADATFCSLGQTT